MDAVNVQRIVVGASTLAGLASGAAALAFAPEDKRHDIGTAVSVFGVAGAIGLPFLGMTTDTPALYAAGGFAAGAFVAGIGANLLGVTDAKA